MDRHHKPENKHGAQFVCCDTDNPKKYIVRCKYCGSLTSIWVGHYYRGSNPCKCRNVKNKRLYGIYINMKTRCFNDKSPASKQYKDNGIGICDEWNNSYKAFEQWSLENGYDDSLTIDRINVYKDYSPDNCRWVDYNEQGNNKRNNIMFIVNGYKASLKRLCAHFSLNYKTVTDWYYSHHRDKKYLISYLRDRTGNGDIFDFCYNDDYCCDLLPVNTEE